MKTAISFLTGILICFAALAQQPFSYPLTPDEIPSKEVYRILQDQEGYIWIGCNAGLFRYDGAAFKQYSNPEMSGRALSNLELDAKGNLWCGSFTGQIFRVENDSLKLFVDWSSKQKQFPSFGTSQDGVWLSSDNGIYHASDNGKTTHFKLPGSERQEIDIIFNDGQGEVITYFRGTGFHKLNSITGQAIPLSFAPISPTLSEGRCYFTKWKGMTLVLWQQVSNGKSVWLEIKEDRVALFEGFQAEPITARVNRICSDRQNRLWVCTNAGAMVFDGSETKTYFPDQRVSDVMEDREGTLWFTTLDNGILAMPSIGIRTYGKALFGKKLSNSTSLTLDASGQILMGNFDGAVITFNPKSETIRPFLEPKNGMHRTVERLQFEDGKLLAARGSFSIWKNGQIDEISVGGNAKDFVRWEGDTILIATVTELAKLHPTVDRKWERKQLREGFCRKVVITSKGEIWAAFKDGVYYGNDLNLVPFLKDGKPVFAADIQIDSLDNVWIATISNGLFKVSEGKIIEEFNTSNGLGSDNLHCMALANDTVWIAHANGLDRFINGKFTHFGLLDGMPLKEVNDMLVSNGNVYLASHNGLTVVPSASIPTNATPPKLITNAISLGDSLISNSENASYNYTFNELKVDLSVLAFRSRGSCKVKYRLLGLDTNWAEQTGNHIEIVYNALPAGSFQFEAFALNEDDVQSEELVSFSFTINPPFWQTWWFYLLVAALSIALVSGLFLLRIRHINRKAALEHAVVTSKLTALRSQMNPHFLFNALNSIQELVLSKDTKNAIRYLGTFSGLTRTILENSAKETVRLSEEIDMLNQYLELEKLRFGDTLEISMVIGPEIDAQGTRIPPMLIQPYVENALKHGLLHLQENRKLVLEFEENGGVLQVTIEDNGVGRAKAEEFAKQKKKHRSFSSEATENRLQAMKNGKGISGSVEVIDLYENHVASGTKVILTIPIH
ncbi:MAG: histidine kinase [Flavobacteriales bacterium]|nr:histidine kinase [Flavobacteriales bacterium]